MKLGLEATPAAIEQNSILVVEDEFLIRAMLSEMLRDAGFTVVEASDADEAVVIFSSVVPDLIITDVRMPGTMDGLQFVAKVRETHKDLPIIVTSAHLTHFDDASDVRTRFVAKPYDFTSVIDVLERELPKTLKLRAK